MWPVYPFTALVGQEKMKLALVLNAISPEIGGVLIRGERGTAKSTAARALAALLPEIEAVQECLFNCDPRDPDRLCSTCRERLARGEALSTLRRRTRFVDLPVSATEDRVVGTLDIERALKTGERRFEPGVLAAANRGLLYVDEVNLLDDHVVDLLLDAAAMGVNVVEREGISFVHPARFILVGTMNPEEGELRPQLLDRFALCVEVRSLADAGLRVAVLERRLAYEADPAAFGDYWAPAEAALSQAIAGARERLPGVTFTARELQTIAELTASLEVDGHRGDLVILKTARANAALEGRTAINGDDIVTAAELALPHRLRHHPLQEAGAEPQHLEARLEQARVNLAQAADVGKKKALRPDSSGAVEAMIPEVGTPLRGHHVDAQPMEYLRGASANVPTGQAFQPRRVQAPLDRITRRSAGRRSFTLTQRKRGRYVTSRPAGQDLSDLALDATLRATAPYQVERGRALGQPLRLQRGDLRRKVRVRRAANLIIFLLDASWSMAAAQRMTATKGAVLSLLLDAYQKRDRVCLAVFQRDRAHLVLPPTNSVELARRMLGQLQVGGKTPLTHGLLMAHEVTRRERQRDREVQPILVILTDGAGNVSLSGRPPEQEASELAARIRAQHIRALVINTEHASLDRGLARQLAEALGGDCLTLAELRADELYRTVRNVMENTFP